MAGIEFREFPVGWRVNGLVESSDPWRVNAGLLEDILQLPARSARPFGRSLKASMPLSPFIAGDACPRKLPERDLLAGLMYPLPGGI
jgi:hypothetical protein